MSVVDAVTRDLESLGDLKDSALAASALELAAAVDKPDNSATSKSMCARELREHMMLLRSLAPDVVVEDKLDDLASRRVARRTKSKTVQRSR